MQKLSLNQKIFKELWVIDYMKAYEWAKENQVTDEEMKEVLHELKEERGN